jgi:hypothetical protein
MPSTPDFKRFLIQFALLTAAGAIAAVAMVVVIDPYGLYRLVSRPVFNQVKPQLKRYQKEIKVELALAAQADTLIIGNSRAEIGFNPLHPALAARASSPFNLALAGSRLSAARSQLASLRAAGRPPRTLIVGVDFLDFLVDPNAPLHSPAVAPSSDAWMKLQWQLDSAFSIDSLTDALGTLRLQRLADPESMTARGFNPFFEYRKMARDEGYYPLFQQRAVDYARRFAARRPVLRSMLGQHAVDVEHLQAILQQSAAEGAHISVVIYPYHAQIMALFEQAGMMPALEQWKAMLALQVEGVRAAHPNAHITLWDFSGYGRYQCEPIPAKGDRTSATAWYWEAGHFKSGLGDLMLDRMLAQPASDAPDGFGMMLSTPVLAANERRLGLERAQCAVANPSLFANAATLYADASRKR